MPKVSICIPTYNQIEYLERCLKSLLIQDYLDYEVIISDDSTTDAVKKYIDSLEFKGSILYFHNSPSLGSPKNWNNAVSKANGEFIKILHHDDFFTETYSLKTYVELLENNPEVDFAFSSTLVWSINENKKHIHKCSTKNFQRLTLEPEFLFFNNVIGAPSATIYRNNKKHVFDINFKWLVDVDFYIENLRVNKKIMYCIKPLICTINGGVGQVTQAVINDKFIQTKEHVLLLQKVISAKSLYKSFIIYFDELFITQKINSINELRTYCEIPEKLNDFFKNVFDNINHYRLFKRVKYRLLNSKYNKNYFKVEKY